MRERATSAISCRQDEAFRLAMRTLASEKGVDVGDLVREALDDKYGEQLAPLLSFFRERGNNSPQMVTQIQRRREKA